MNTFRKVFAILILLFGAVGVVSAQSTQGEIVGTAKDASGASVPGVTVTVKNIATGLARTATSADNGAFRFPALPTGTYRLSAEKSGFAKITVESIEVTVAETRTVDLNMQIAGRAESVTVQGTVPLVNTETQHLGAVIDQAQVTTLPLNGRNFAQLALLNAGVSAFGGGGGQQGGEGGVSGYSSNGQRSSSNNFMVDGIDNNEYQGGSVSQTTSIDSIQEFQVQTNNYAAEYGRNSGSVINLVTKSGTNKFHGSLYEFLRNDAFDARNFFANPNAPAPELRLNQFGVTLGGPIKTDKTFFFGNYEGFRRRAGISELTNVPTDAERNGTFANPAGGTITVPVNSTSAALFKLFPEPNSTQPGGNFISSPALSQDTNQYLIKLDHGIGNDTFTARYSFTDSNTFFPFAPGQETTSIPGYGNSNDGTTHLFSLGYTKIIGPSSLNEFRVGFSRFTTLSVNQVGPQAADFGFNNGHPAGEGGALGNIPNITFAGGLVSGAGTSVSNLGANNNNPGGTWENTIQFIDHFSHTTARHEMKFGFDIRNVRLNTFYDLDIVGQISFDGTQNPQGIPNPLLDFAEGLPVSSLQFVGDSHRSFRYTSYDLFAQDSFKIRRNLTLNYGLRYELNTVLHEATGRGITWRPDRFKTFLNPFADQTDLATLEASGMVPESATGLYNPDHNNFAPRFGIAWSLGQKHETVVRTGYGIFFDTVIGNIPSNTLLNPPFMPDFFNSAPFINWPNSFGATGFPVITVTPANLATPYSQAWNLDIQHQLPAQMVFEIAYVGTTGTHLPRFRQINQAFITQAQIDGLTPDVVTRMELMGIPPSIAQILAQNIAAIPPVARVPFFGFPQIFQPEDSVSSSYNGLQVKLNERPTRGLTFGIAYTFSRSIDGASVFFGSGANATTIFPQNNYDTRAEKGLSDFDTRHRFVANYIYDIPTLRHLASGIPHAIADGWVVTGILTLQTGQPFSVLTGAGNSSDGLGNDRPNVSASPNTGPRTVQKWFNTSVFTLNAPLTFGNAGRNIITGPPFKNFDFALLKNTKLTEQANLQFRAEFFNIFNHPNFALPNNTLSSPNFGSLFRTPDVAQNNVGLGSGGPRLIQFGLKLNF